MSLSDKRKKLLAILCMQYNVTDKQRNILMDIFEDIEKQDKEFIKELKERIKKQNDMDGSIKNNCSQYVNRDLCKLIDKLAGPELTEEKVK